MDKEKSFVEAFQNRDGYVGKAESTTSAQQRRRPGALSASSQIWGQPTKSELLIWVPEKGRTDGGENVKTFQNEYKNFKINLKTDMKPRKWH